jgi:hypothetical protein
VNRPGGRRAAFWLGRRSACWGRARSSSWVSGSKHQRGLFDADAHPAAGLAHRHKRTRPLQWIIDPNLMLAAIVAVATLVGAAVGGAITAVVTLRAEHKRQEFAEQQRTRQEKREQEREEQHRRRELKEAARLIDEELRDATELIRDAIYQGRFWVAPRQISASDYSAYRHVLAVNLDDHAWTDVSLAFQQIHQVNCDIHGIPENSDGTRFFGPLDRIEMLSVGIQIVRARKALAQFSSPPDKDALLNQDATDMAAAIFPLPEEEAED